jgi:hypothetical protein
MLMAGPVYCERIVTTGQGTAKHVGGEAGLEAYPDWNSRGWAEGTALCRESEGVPQNKPLFFLYSLLASSVGNADNP